MSHSHDTFSDDLAAYALGSLEPEDAARLERHLRDCAGCRQALREYDEVMRLLPLGLPPAEPSPGARRELIHRLRVAHDAQRRDSPPGWWPRLRVQALTVVAVVAFVLAGAAVWSQFNRDNGDDAAAIVENLRDEPDTRIVALRGSEAAPQAVGQLVFQPGESRAGLVVSGLPPLPGDRAYQLWFIQPDDSRIDGGVFSVDEAGKAIVVIDAPAAYDYGWSCGVTEEPAAGSPQPTGRNVLRGVYERYDW
ncbi:MAG: anti-sigma factor [Vicinamibacterales bacterium]